MNWIKPTKKQTQAEENWNVISHVLGIIIGIIGLVLMVLKSDGNALKLFSSLVFGISFILLFLASSLYHVAKNPGVKKKLRVLDHASIFLLIAGTYTPITLLVLGKPIGWVFFGIEWTLAFLGILLKLKFTGRYEKISLFIYLLMGWLIVFDFSELLEKLPLEGIQYIIYGGLSYTIGVIFYSLKRVYFSHVIWHFFVLAGSAFNFWFVYAYVL